MKKISKITAVIVLTIIAPLLAGCSDKDSVSDYPDAVLVKATVETEPVPNGGDAADDPCIWIHPSDPSLSVIIGTDKKGGLAVYDLSGQGIQYLTDGKMNNVDIRYNFPLGGKYVALVTASNRTDNSIAIYQMNPETRELESVAAGKIYAEIEVYGSCMYHSSISGKYYCYVNSTNGTIQQWELFDNGDEKVDAILVRTFEAGSRAEGCVTDDELSFFYIGEEEVAIWKYGAEPEDGSNRTVVDLEGEHFKKNVEGLTIYYAGDTTGYLIASSQGNSTFVVYKREGTNEYVTIFGIEEGNGIDRVSGTDGIDVVNFNLGDDFPEGVFVAQDDVNSGGENQNFKLVPWQAIANSVDPPLKIDVSWDPRLVGN
jgi:3-phytase